MKKSAIKFFDKIILLLLGFSGMFYTSCEYGMPAPEYGMPVPEYGVPPVEIPEYGIPQTVFEP